MTTVREMTQALKMIGGALGTAIIKYPSGRYGLVGRVPTQPAWERAQR